MRPSPLYDIPSTVMLQKVDDETLLFDSETGSFFNLNYIGTIMWEVIAENTSIITVYKELQKIFDIPEKQLQTDLLAFSKALHAQGLLIIKSL